MTNPRDGFDKMMGAGLGDLEDLMKGAMDVEIQMIAVTKSTMLQRILTGDTITRYDWMFFNDSIGRARAFGVDVDAIPAGEYVHAFSDNPDDPGWRPTLIVDATWDGEKWLR